MNYKKIYELISRYKDEIDSLEELRLTANNREDYGDAEYYHGCIITYEHVIANLETLVNDEFASLECLVHEHRAESILAKYCQAGV